MHEVLCRIMTAFMEEGGWIGHMYGIEYLEDDYKKVIDYLMKNGLEYRFLYTAYEQAKNTADHPYPGYENHLRTYDERFLKLLAEACKVIVEREGYEDDEFLSF